MSVILPIVIGVVRDSNGNILLGRRHQPEIPEIHGKWNLLGGKIEFGETTEQALIREIKEESGLEIEIVRMMPEIFTRFVEKANGTKMHVLPITYECKVSGGSLHDPISDPGVSELRFFAPYELNIENMNKHDHHIIEVTLTN